MTLYQPAAYYLPHQPPMVFIEKVCAIEEESVMCEVCTDSAIMCPFLTSQGRLPAWFAIEMMAQTIGVWSGYWGMRKRLQPKLGLLLGSRAFKSELSEFPAGSRLRISAEKLLQDNKLANFDCKIELDGQVVAQAKLNVYQPDDEEITRLIQGDVS